MKPVHEEVNRVRENLLLEEAQEVLLNQARPLGEVMVPLTEAWGRVISRDIRAGANIPPFNKSPLDGYALRASDTKKASPSNPVGLKVREVVRAGFMPEQEVIPGTAIKVMTGAPLPAGADVVIKYEDVKEGKHGIEVYQPLKAGDNIILVGDDITQGELVSGRGSLVNPALAGLLASLGLSEIPVFFPIRAAIVSTGDELILPFEPLTPGKIYNSSLYTLAARCRELGVLPAVLGNVSDKAEAVAGCLQQGLDTADIVISTGGVSVGDYDVVRNALLELGTEIIFWKIRMKPGSPLIAARKDNKIIIGLSGNPAAAMVSFDLVAVPVLKKMMGQDQLLPRKIKAIFLDRFDKPSPERRFLRAQLHRRNGMDFVRLTGGQGNGVLKSLVACNVLIDVPAGSGPLKTGQQVNAYITGNINESYQDDLRSSLMRIAY